MSGIGLVASIAKDALAAQRHGMDVTAHNIANVNTAGYSRQSLVLKSRDPVPLGGLLYGRGVDADQIVRIGDQLIENRLMQENSSMLFSGEMENYMQVLEGVFSESSETNVGSLLAGYWNLWHDAANNPSGMSERGALYEHSVLLTTQFNSLDSDMKQLDTDLTLAVSAGLDKINQITAEIARINDQIVRTGSNSIANDLYDHRNALLSELSGHIDSKSFEQTNGMVTVITAKGCVLVNDSGNYTIGIGGADSTRIEWENSSGATVDITDHISKGKLGGWLEIRDEILPKYEMDLDAVTKEFLWSVNQQHSQGVGLQTMTSVTGTYASSSPGNALGAANSGLSFYDRINDGGFKLWLYDQNGDVAIGGGTTIAIDADVTSLNDIAAGISGIHANITATVNNGKLQIAGANGYTFAFSDDTSNVPAALGINTFFTGTGAGNIGVNEAIIVDKDNIAIAQIDNDGTFAQGDNTNALAITDLQHTPTNISQWTVDRISGNTEGTITSTLEDYYQSMIGSIGIVSESISRSKALNEVMVSKLGEIRDGISAVSLDEEMTNLVKYQHAYTAAAKLLGVVDEMLGTLLELK